MTPTQAQPKFKPGETINFSFTLMATAVINDEGEWDEDEKQFLYAVKNVKVTDVGSRSDDDDIYLEEVSVKVDEEGSILREKQLSGGSILLPSCEFDPN